MMVTFAFNELKYRSHPSILTLKEVCKERPATPFSFSEVCKEEILKDILNSGTSTVSQDTDFATRFIKKNADIFAEFLH